MNPTTADHPAHTQPATELRWRRALGLQLLGPVQGSGLRDVAYLVRRSDDQMVQLSELLHLVVVHVEPPRPATEVAAAVSAAYGRTLTVEGHALAQLDRGPVVRDADEREPHDAKWVIGSTTATSTKESTTQRAARTPRRPRSWRSRSRAA